MGNGGDDLVMCAHGVVVQWRLHAFNQANSLLVNGLWAGHITASQSTLDGTGYIHTMQQGFFFVSKTKMVGYGFRLALGRGDARQVYSLVLQTNKYTSPPARTTNPRSPPSLPPKRTY